jgi:hypothetical protein
LTRWLAWRRHFQAADGRERLEAVLPAYTLSHHEHHGNQLGLFVRLVTPAANDGVSAGRTM